MTAKMLQDFLELNKYHELFYNLVVFVVSFVAYLTLKNDIQNIKLI